MKVLVTGAGGFLSGHVCRTLRDRGHEVVEINHSQFELMNPGAAELAMARAERGAVVHLAARVGGIGANQRQPGTFWRNNLLMGVNVLESCMSQKVKKLVMVGTTCSYPKTPATIPFIEGELFDGYPEETNAPYGIAKRALIVGADAYRREFGLNVVTLIPTNLYGPGDNFNPESSHVIPALIKRMHEAKVSGADSVTLWGTGSPTRDFLYVEDAADAVECAVRVYDQPAPVNVGSGRETSIRQIAAMVRLVVGYTGVVAWDKSKPDGQPRRCLDTRRAEEHLKWASRTSLADGLRKTYEWWFGGQNRFGVQGGNKI